MSAGLFAITSCGIHRAQTLRECCPPCGFLLSPLCSPFKPISDYPDGQQVCNHIDCNIVEELLVVFTFTLPVVSCYLWAITWDALEEIRCNLLADWRDCMGSS
jgi:hypothetical protein